MRKQIPGDLMLLLFKKVNEPLYNDILKEAQTLIPARTLEDPSHIKRIYDAHNVSDDAVLVRFYATTLLLFQPEKLFNINKNTKRSLLTELCNVVGESVYAVRTKIKFAVSIYQDSDYWKEEIKDAANHFLSYLDK